MISATNGFDVANKQALRDKWDVTDFLKNGKKETPQKKKKVKGESK